MEADRARARSHAEATAAVATALTPLLGYDTAAEVVAEAGRSGRTVREVVLARGLLDEATLDERLDLVALTRP
jgi:aspartate ammonia-lyase